MFLQFMETSSTADLGKGRCLDSLVPQTVVETSGVGFGCVLDGSSLLRIAQDDLQKHEGFHASVLLTLRVAPVWDSWGLGGVRL